MLSLRSLSPGAAESRAWGTVQGELLCSAPLFPLVTIVQANGGRGSSGVQKENSVCSERQALFVWACPPRPGCGRLHLPGGRGEWTEK